MCINILLMLILYTSHRAYLDSFNKYLNCAYLHNIKLFRIYNMIMVDNWREL